MALNRALPNTLFNQLGVPPIAPEPSRWTDRMNRVRHPDRAPAPLARLGRCMG
jgi:hypothetical protein